MFANEGLLTEEFDAALSGKRFAFSSEKRAREFEYTEGRTDLVVSDGEGTLFAFEMKLAKWRKALHQAYRNSSFAHYSYVVLPEQTAKSAARMQNEFLRRGVGLCSVGGDFVRIEIEARRSEPLRPWLTQQALAFSEGGMKNGGTAEI